MAKQELSLEIFGGDYTQSELPHPEIAQIFAADVQAALNSARIVRRYFNDIPLEKLRVEYKKDETPKSIADTEGDFAIYEAIRSFRPYDNMLLEETGYHKGLTNLHPTIPTFVRHYADSLDGSRPFTEKKPWSVVGVSSIDEENGEYLASAIVHPYRQQLAVAIRGMGAYLIPLDADLLPNGQPERMYVSKKDSLAGATISIDSLFPTKHPVMRRMKHSLMMQLEDLGVTSWDMVGSNIAYQMDVAAGKSIAGITDAVGGPWDWRAGQPLVVEADGTMLDGQTGKEPHDKSELLVYGPKAIVDQIIPVSMSIYSPKPFSGFNNP